MTFVRIFRLMAKNIFVIIMLFTLLTYPSSITLAQGPTGEILPDTSSVETPLTRLEAIINQNVVQTTDDVNTAESLKKMDSHLQTLVADYLSNTDVLVTTEEQDLQVTDDGNVLIDIHVTGFIDEASNLLEQQGMQIIATNDHFNIVEGLLPIDEVLAVTNLSFTKALIPVMAFGIDVGAVTSQGDASHNGPAARSLVDGDSVVVGIISDSMDQVGTGLAGSQATGDLPATVSILNDGNPGDSDEGRAMAEIIYDTAPGITAMFFDSGTVSGPVGKAAAIANLTTNGVDIIADDIYYLTEPFFQDGPVAQAVDTAVGNGVAYFASAGNRGRQSYESNYLSNTGSVWHDFDSSWGVDEVQTIVDVPDGGWIQVVLQWDDAWNSASHNFDVFLYEVGPTTQLASGTTDNVTTGLPLETVYWQNNTGATVTVGVAIQRVSGTGISFLKYIARGNIGTFTINEWNTASDAIDPGAASARGAMTVAAVSWNDPGLNDPDNYSSRGPKTRLFDANGNRLASPEIRQKPQVAGAACVATSFGFGGGSFCGTSAAAPSVAGVAALVKSARPNITPHQLYATLTNPINTVDCTLAGSPDNDCGYGFVLADLALFNIINPTTIQPAFAGPYNNPSKLVVHTTKPADQLTKSNFVLKVNGNPATIVTVYEGTDEYVLEVIAPTQSVNGLYDLTVTVNLAGGGTATRTQLDAVHYTDTNNVDAVLVIDRSGSMGSGTDSKMENAKEAARLFVDFMRDNDKVGVVSFSSSARVDYGLSTIVSGSGNPVFSDDMESGAGQWTAELPWTQVITHYNSASHSWSVNPSATSLGYINASLTSNAFDLSSLTKPTLRFSTRYSNYYDHRYVEISVDGGISWATLDDYYRGSQTAWVEKSIPLDAYSGQSSVKIRFRFGDYLYYDSEWNIDDVQVIDGSTKDRAKSAISAIFSGGSTSIGDGLQDGQSELTNNGDAAHPWAIVLLSDGYENRAPYVADILPGIKTTKTIVHTVGLGSTDEALLLDIAAQTGGTYNYDPTGNQLSRIYSTIADAVSNQQTLFSETGVIQQGVTDEKSVIVDSTISEATFSISWSNSASILALTLEKPDGTVIDPTSASNADIDYTAGSTYAYYRVKDTALMVGVWKIKINGGTVSSSEQGIIATAGGETYTARVTGQAQLIMQTYLDKDNYLTLQPIKVSATLADNQPILGATVSVNFQPPASTAAVLDASDWIEINGDTMPAPGAMASLNKESILAAAALTLHDDGAHNDGQANDGVYANTLSFLDTETSGTYTFDVMASGTDNNGHSFVRQDQKIVHVAANPGASISRTYLPVVVK